jgi:hypothetical protein
LTLALLAAVLFPSSFLNVAPASAQCSYTPGTPVQLTGTPHLFIVDDNGILHWGGDTRALAGRTINWGSQCAVGLAELMRTPRGDPWLSAGLPKVGEPIFLAKWEDTDPAPTLLHIQSIADVELFGINEGNYGNFVLDQPAWEQRFGFQADALQVGPLASAASFAWNDADRAAYGQLLLDLKRVESAALAQLVSTGVPAATALPNLITCEKQGLDLFDTTRNGPAALQTTQACLGGAPPPAVTTTPGSPAGAPLAPGGLQVIAAAGASAQLNWTDLSTNEDGFQIYRNDGLIGTVGPNATSYVDTGRNPAVSNCYRVAAYNSQGSATSQAVCPTSGAATSAPSAPSNLQVGPTSPTSITLTWTDTSTNEDGFYIYEGSNTVGTVGANVNSWTISPWDPALRHCYEIAAYNSLGQSAHSNSVCAGPGSPAGPLPGAPGPVAPGGASVTPVPAPIPQGPEINPPRPPTNPGTR